MQKSLNRIKPPENLRFRGEICTNIAVLREYRFYGGDENAPFLQSERDAFVQNSEAELQSFEARWRELKLAH